MTFALANDLGGQIQGQKTGYQISSRNYVSTRTKVIVSNHKVPWANYTPMTYGLAFDLEFELQCQI